MPAAGNIATHRPKRPHKLAGGQAAKRRRTPRSRHLLPGKRANLFRRRRQCIAQLRANRLPRRGHLLLASRAHDSAPARPSNCAAYLQQRAIAALAHIGHNAPDCRQHRVQRRPTAPFQRGQHFCSLRCASSFCTDQLHRSPICSATSFEQCRLLQSTAQDKTADAQPKADGCAPNRATQLLFCSLSRSSDFQRVDRPRRVRPESRIQKPDSPCAFHSACSDFSRCNPLRRHEPAPVLRSVEIPGDANPDVSSCGAPHGICAEERFPLLVIA